MFDSADEVLAALQADAEVMARVGQYTFQDGFQAAAITILSGNEAVDGLQEVSGLEVVINRTPTTRSKPTFSGGLLMKEWAIHLIQYEPGPAAMELADLLACRYPGTTYASLGAGSMPQVAGVEQVVIKIPFNVPA